MIDVALLWTCHLVVDVALRGTGIEQNLKYRKLCATWHEVRGLFLRVCFCLADGY